MKGVETGKKELYGRIRWPMCDMCTHNTHTHTIKLHVQVNIKRRG